MCLGSRALELCLSPSMPHVAEDGDVWGGDWVRLMPWTSGVSDVVLSGMCRVWEGCIFPLVGSLSFWAGAAVLGNRALLLLKPFDPSHLEGRDGAWEQACVEAVGLFGALVCWVLGGEEGKYVPRSGHGWEPR